MTLMESKKQTPKYTAEFRERGVLLYREQRADYTSDNAAYRAIASKLGCSHDTLRSWCIQAARDAGERSGPSGEEKARIKDAGAREPGAAHRQRDPEEGVGIFCPGGARPPFVGKAVHRTLF